MKKHYRVIIPPTAKESSKGVLWTFVTLSSILRGTGPSAAIKVRKKLIETAKSLKELPERFSGEVYLKDKPGAIIVQLHNGTSRLFTRF